MTDERSNKQKAAATPPQGRRRVVPVDERPTAGSDGGEDVSENDRPTVNPPFDVEAYARAATGSPGHESALSPEEPEGRGPAPPAMPRFGAEPRSRQITVTNEAELEAARAQSEAAMPHRSNTPSVLSMANARASSSPSGADTEPPASSSHSRVERAVVQSLGSSPGPEITERTIEDPVAEMHDRFSLGDYTGALEMSELILAEDPTSSEASDCGENCRTILENMYAARLGPLDRVPIVVVPRTQMRWLSMDHRAGFVLSLIDGSSTVEMILDVCGMPKLDAFRILHELVQQKIVSFR